MGLRHILVPTDGSVRSRNALAIAIGLAQALGAHITGLYVLAEGVPTLFSGARLYGSGVVGRRYRDLARRQADAALAQVERSAGHARVPCRTLRRLARQPWRAILTAARSGRCDLIVMGSHGRGGVQSILLGSQTAKVLAHSKTPVLVCR